MLRITTCSTRGQASGGLWTAGTSKHSIRAGPCKRRDHVILTRTGPQQNEFPASVEVSMHLPVQLDTDQPAALRVPQPQLDRGPRVARGRLDPRLEQIMECRYFAGLSVGETAQALGLSERTVEREVLRARGYLRRAMQADDG